MSIEVKALGGRHDGQSYLLPDEDCYPGFVFHASNIILDEADKPEEGKSLPKEEIYILRETQHKTFAPFVLVHEMYDGKLKDI